MRRRRRARAGRRGGSPPARRPRSRPRATAMPSPRPARAAPVSAGNSQKRSSDPCASQYPNMSTPAPDAAAPRWVPRRPGSAASSAHTRAAPSRSAPTTPVSARATISRAVRESWPLRALALSQVCAPEVVGTGPHERSVLELAPRNAPVVVAIRGEAGTQPARPLRRAVTALLELVPGVGAGRDRVALDDRVSRDDGDGRERDGDHRRGADAARACRGDPNAFVGQRGQGADNGEARAREQQRPQRAVEDGSGRAAGLQFAVDVEQRVKDQQDRRADGSERRDGPAAAGDHENGQHGNDREGHQPATALAEERGAGEQARGAQEQPP